MSLPSAYEPHPWCPTLERFEHSKASKIHNGLMFDFYLGLPHVPYSNDSCTAYTPIVYFLSYIQVIRTWRVKRPRTRVIMKGACSQFVYMNILCTCTKEGGGQFPQECPCTFTVTWSPWIISQQINGWIICIMEPPAFIAEVLKARTLWTCQYEHGTDSEHGHIIATCVYAKPPCNNLQ